MRRVAVVLIVWALWVTPALAQDEVPELSELLALERQVILLEVEVIQQRLGALQAELALAQERVNQRFAVFQAKVVSETDVPDGTTYDALSGSFSVPPPFLGPAAPPADAGESP